MYRIVAKARDVKAPVTITTVTSRNAALAALDTIATLRKQDGLFVQRQGKRGRRLNMYQQDQEGYLRSVGQVWIDQMHKTKPKNPKAYEAYVDGEDFYHTPHPFPTAHEARRSVEYTIRKARQERRWTCRRIDRTTYECTIPGTKQSVKVGYRRAANATQDNVAGEATVG